MPLGQSFSRQIAFLAFITICAAIVSVIWLLSGAPGRLAGIWTGTLQLGCSSLRLVLHVTADSAGKPQVSLDSVDQLAIGLPMDKVFVKGKLFSFHNPSSDARYQATLYADGDTLDGIWTEEMSVPLVLTRITAAAAPTPEPTPTFMGTRAQEALKDLKTKPQSACGAPSADTDGGRSPRGERRPFKRDALPDGEVARRLEASGIMRRW